MPRQNRVGPFGAIEAVDARGTLTGNRGILHGPDGRLGRARWRHIHWIACWLDWKGVRRTVMAPGSWTELFFLDEATALAAGHRPCALCRRDDYRRFVAAWRATGREASAAAIDRMLHAARIDPATRAQRRFVAEAADLPAGTFVAPRPDEAWLLLDDHARRWTHRGYLAGAARPSGPVTVLTPAPLVDVLRAGYRPMLHPGACAPSGP